jgi:methionyl aminopeptidase
VRKRRPSRTVVLKAPWEIEEMRSANRIVAEVLEVLRRSLVPGISTGDLDRIAEDGIIKRGGRPAFKGYHDFPATLCVSINSEVVHGIPSPRRILNEGDLVSLDLGAVYHGFFGDAAISATVGTGSEVAGLLIDVTREALERGIDSARARGRLQDISWAVQRHVEVAGFSVVRQFVGHGIGGSLHEPPEVPNYGVRGQGALLMPGMVLAIEPMVNVGSSEVRVLEDGWTAVTLDGSLSAHFEHSVAITGDGPDVLSRLD